MKRKSKKKLAPQDVREEDLFISDYHDDIYDRYGSNDQDNNPNVG